MYEESDGLLEKAMNKFSLNGRANSRILNFVRTIADFEGSKEIEPSPGAAAIEFRTLDPRMFR